nr:hypothetical protein [Tanacetum cinerariifolium]
VPEDSLIMGNEELSTILEKESDEVIKSSVEDFVLIPSEPEDTSENDNFNDGYYDSEGDVLYLDSLLSDDTTPNLPHEVFQDRDPRSLSDINDLKIMAKIFDPGIPEKFFSPTYFLFYRDGGISSEWNFHML